MQNIAKKIAILSVLGLTIGTSGIIAQEKSSNYDTYKKVAALVAAAGVGAVVGKIAFDADPPRGINLLNWFILGIVQGIVVDHASNVIWNGQASQNRPQMQSAAFFASWMSYLALWAKIV
jgi:hypothetical protein